MSDKPKVDWSNIDGNVFCLMASASKALKNAGQGDKADEMVKRINDTAQSYDQAIQIMMEYVEVE